MIGKFKGNKEVDSVLHAVVSSSIHQQDKPTCVHTGWALEYVTYPKKHKIVKINCLMKKKYELTGQL